MKNTIIGAFIGIVLFVCLAAKTPIVQDIIQVKPAKPKSQVIVYCNFNVSNKIIKKFKVKGYHVDQISATIHGSNILFVKY